MDKIGWIIYEECWGRLIEEERANVWMDRWIDGYGWERMNA